MIYAELATYSVDHFPELRGSADSEINRVVLSMSKVPLLSSRRKGVRQETTREQHRMTTEPAKETRAGRQRCPSPPSRNKEKLPGAKRKHISSSGATPCLSSRTGDSTFTTISQFPTCPSAANGTEHATERSDNTTLEEDVDSGDSSFPTAPFSTAVATA